MKSRILTVAAIAFLVVAGPTVAQSDAVTATGTVKRVDPGKRIVNLSHAPIPAISWPAMTMDFAVAPAVDLSGVKPGQEVEVTLVPKQGSSMDYTVTHMKPKGG